MKRALAPVVAGAMSFLAISASAQVGRRRFDPEDLKLEEAGVVHLDLQLGVIRGPDAGRLLIPDFGIDVGLTSRVELGVDGSFALEGTPSSAYVFKHSTGDNLWFSSKLGLFDHRDPQSGTAWAGGLQLGPRLAVAPGTSGAGFETLLLLGRTRGVAQIIANLGGFVDPIEASSRRHPVGIEAGPGCCSGAER